MWQPKYSNEALMLAGLDTHAYAQGRAAHVEVGVWVVALLLVLMAVSEPSQKLM
jgi:hypothetical protein